MLSNTLAAITAFTVYVIKTFGYLGVGAIIFSESGLLLGLVLPGDSLIFLAGILAAQGFFNVGILLAVTIVAAILGDNLGYFIGKRLGRKVFTSRNTFFFNPDNLRKTEEFFARYGKSTFLMQRFVPVVRVFAPLLGGVGMMDYRLFFWSDLAGCVLWGASGTLLGYFLGATVPGIDRYLLPAVLVVVVLSLIPTAVTYHRQKRRQS